MRKTCLGSGFSTHVTGTTVRAVADSSIQLRCIHTCVLVLIQPRSRRIFKSLLSLLQSRQGFHESLMGVYVD